MKQVGHSNRKCETFGGSKLVCSDSCWSFGGGQGAQNRSKKGPGTKSRGARRHQGGSEEAARRHQGGTKEAPSK